MNKIVYIILVLAVHNALYSITKNVHEECQTTCEQGPTVDIFLENEDDEQCFCKSDPEKECDDIECECPCHEEPVVYL